MHKLLALSLLLASAAPASAVVLTFEDLGPGTGPVPDGYGGIADWGSYTHYDAVDVPYPAHSGTQRVFLDNVASSRFVFGTPVVFEGAWFAGYGEDDGPDEGNVFFRLFSGNTLVHTSAALDPSDVPTFLGTGYTGLVSAVEIGETRGPNGFWVFDDLTYSSPVPEPATLAALGMGLLALARRRARH